MKSLYQFINEPALTFFIPCFTVSAMVDLMNSKSEKDIFKFYDDQGLDAKYMNVPFIMRSIHELTSCCKFYTKPGKRLFDEVHDSEVMKSKLGITAKYWLVYHTEGDNDVLVVEGNSSKAAKVIEEFADQIDFDVDYCDYADGVKNRTNY